MTLEEIDKRLSEWLSTQKSHVMVIEQGSKTSVSCTWMTWEEFFYNVDRMKDAAETLFIIKEEHGATILWTEK